MFGFNMKNKAFTLAEILIVFTIIGVITGITLMTTKKMDNSDRRAYSRAYDALLTAAFNAQDDQGDVTTPYKLCKGLSNYINSHSENCGESNDDEESKFIGDLTFDSAAGHEPNFVANNGMAFYITETQTIEVTTFDNDSAQVPFRVVYIDIDGQERGHNSVSSGDIVAFAVTDNADVIPLGAPVYDKRYITASVVVPARAHKADGANWLEEEDPEHTLSPTSYYDAMVQAWGGIKTLDDLRTIDFNQHFNSNPTFKVPAPYTVGEATIARGATKGQVPECVCDNSAGIIDELGNPGTEDDSGNKCIGNLQHTDNDALTADENKQNKVRKYSERLECDIRIQRYY